MKHFCQQRLSLAPAHQRHKPLDSPLSAYQGVKALVSAHQKRKALTSPLSAHQVCKALDSPVSAHQRHQVLTSTLSAYQGVKLVKLRIIIKLSLKLIMSSANQHQELLSDLLRRGRRSGLRQPSWAPQWQLPVRGGQQRPGQLRVEEGQQRP